MHNIIEYYKNKQIYKITYLGLNFCMFEIRSYILILNIIMITTEKQMHDEIPKPSLVLPFNYNQ